MAPPGGGEDGSTAEDAKNDEVFEQTQQQQLGAPGNVADRPILERKDTLSPRPGRNTKKSHFFVFTLSFFCDFVHTVRGHELDHLAIHSTTAVAAEARASTNVRFRTILRYEGRFL